MKYIAFIGLGVVLLLTICGVVLWANMPSAKLTVHVVRPMGTNFIRTNSVGDQLSWPVWEVAITNSGRALAAWIAGPGPTNMARGNGLVDSWGFVAAGGDLAAGQHTNVYMPVPLDPKNWEARVKYRTARRSPLEMRLSSWCTPVPELRHLLPNYDVHYACDRWQSATNVTAAH